MPETPTPTPPPGIGNPTAPVPKAALLPATVAALLTVLGVFCFAALLTPVLGCVPSFAWETTALLGVFDPAHPVHVYNPTATTNPLALASLYFSQLPPIEPSSEAKHYHDIQFEFLLLACSAIMATGLRHVPNDILQLARSYEIG